MNGRVLRILVVLVMASGCSDPVQECLSTCAGCCDSAGSCNQGNQAAACGKAAAGQADFCAVCADGSECVAGACAPVCRPSGSWLLNDTKVGTTCSPSNSFANFGGEATIQVQVDGTTLTITQTGTNYTGILDSNCKATVTAPTVQSSGDSAAGQTCNRTGTEPGCSAQLPFSCGAATQCHATYAACAYSGQCPGTPLSSSITLSRTLTFTGNAVQGSFSLTQTAEPLPVTYDPMIPCTTSGNTSGSRR